MVHNILIDYWQEFDSVQSWQLSSSTNPIVPVFMYLQLTSAKMIKGKIG